MRRTLNSLTRSQTKHSLRSYYTTSNNDHTVGNDFETTQSFVRAALRESGSGTGLDAGWTNRHFIANAALQGFRLTAVNYDSAVLGYIWRARCAERLDILPLSVNVTRPKPGIHWHYRECASFLGRARDSLVLMLAVIHHLLLKEALGLSDILKLASGFTTGTPAFEYGGSVDPMFRQLIPGRDEPRKDLSPELFERIRCRHFDIVRFQHVEGTAQAPHPPRRRLP